MIFTHHAAERYRQFWMLDQPTATDAEAMAILEAHGEQAVKLPSRTVRGDEVWTIHALGVELVVKRDLPQPCCVTVLPPARFRGLTPLQAERIEVDMRAAEVKSAELAHEAEELAAVVVVQTAKATKPTSEEHREKDRLLARLAESKRQVQLAEAERHVLGGILKTMQTQLVEQSTAQKVKQALRIAIRELRVAGTPHAQAALEDIAAIDAGLLSDGFLYPRGDE